MLKFLDSKDLLEEIVELLFGQGQFAVKALLLRLLLLLRSRPARPSRIVLAHAYAKSKVSLFMAHQLFSSSAGQTFENGVKLDHPRGKDRLLGEPVNVGQGSHSPLDAEPENVAEILGRQAAGRHGPQDPIRAEEKVHVTLNGIVEGLVGQDGRLSFEEALENYQKRRSL